VFGEWLEVDVVNSVGPIGVWACYRIVENAWRPTSVHCAESTWAELGAKPFANLGARADTIRKAADPVAAFHASRKRFTTRASPRCTAALAQYKARP
jgi:hypothetical protein